MQIGPRDEKVPAAAWPSFVRLREVFSDTAFWDFLPAAGLAGFEHGIANVLRFQGIAEGRTGWFAVFNALEEIGDLVDKAMFVANLQARHPPVLHVRLVAITDVNRAPATNFALVAMVEILEPVQIVKVPENGRVLAIDLEGVERLVAAGVTGRLERGQ